jgi:folate-binding protein YgfZ
MDRGLLRLTGPQRVWFLQQTITADVEDVPSGEWRESAFLTPKGKVVSHFFVGLLDDEVFLDIDPPHDQLADWLTRYRFRTKVEIEDVSSEVATVLDDLAPDGAIRRIGEAIVFGHRLGDVALATVHGPLPSGAVAADPDEVEGLRVAAGVPRFGVDYTTDNLPQEAGLTRVVPIDKGCYVGQETVARIHFRGHVNKVVRSLELRDAPGALGATLELDGERVGTITSVAGNAGIGMVRTEPAEGAEARVSTGGVAVLGPLPEGTKIRAS